MNVLPSGDEDASGVALVTSAARMLEKAVGTSASDMNKRNRILESSIHDVIQSCNSQANPGSFRNCQVAARLGINGLLSIAQLSPKIDTRIHALTALACLSFDNLENASLAVTSEMFEPMVSRNLRPITEIREQESVLSLIRLLQAICAIAPEAPALVPVVPNVLELLIGTQEGHPACTAVRIVALEFLVSCSLSHQRRTQLLSLLPESVVKLLIDSVESQSHGTTMIFPLGLLFANLSDLSNSTSGNEVVVMMPMFNGIDRLFWERTGFFSDLHACLEASLNSQSWPPQSGIYHARWKLANTYCRLSVAGFVDELRNAVNPLVSLVEYRAIDGSAVADADDARAARSAVQVLRALASDEATIAQIRSSQKLPHALVSMQNEEPAAMDLLNILSGVAAQGQGLQNKTFYTEEVTTPW